jgi:D-tyrosyl-tRNA(Tyr) deacylase
MKKKIYTFNILEDDSRTMSTSLKNLNEDIMIISQFTLAAITSKGTNPSFHKAAKPEEAKLLYYEFVNECKKEQNNLVEGIFAEQMDIQLVNKGPITFNFKVN